MFSDPATIPERAFEPYVGTPFKSRGRDRFGSDCWGLFRLIYRDLLSVELPEHGAIDADDTAKVARTVGANKDDWRLIEDGKYQACDGALMLQGTRDSEGRPTRLYSHIGIMVSSAKVLHVHSQTDAVIVPLDRLSARQPLVYRYVG